MSTAVGLIRIGFRSDVAPLAKGIDSARGMVARFAGGISGLASGGLANLHAGLTMANQALGKFNAVVGESLGKTVELDSAMNLMSRTTGYAASDIADLEGDMWAMATSAEMAGTSMKDLTTIGVMGGRMGVDRRKMPAFIRDIAQVAIVLDDIPVEEAAEGLSKLNKQFGKGDDQIRGTAAALNILSNNARTTGGAILDVAGGMKDGAALMGLGVEETLAISTALLDAGLSAEVAQNNFKLVLAKMSQEASAFAKVAGVSFAEFDDALNRRPLEAIKMFLAGLTGTRQDYDLLESVGITGVRESSVVLQLRAAGDALQGFVDMSEQEAKTQERFGAEVSKSTEKIESQMKLLDQRIDKVSTGVGKELAPAVGAARLAWVQLVEHNADNLIRGAHLAAATIKGITPAVKGVADFAIRGFGLAAASITGLAGGALHLIGGLGKALEWVANLVPGVEIDVADGISSLARKAMASADRQFGRLTDIPRAFDSSDAFEALGADAGAAADAIGEVADAMGDVARMDPLLSKSIEDLTAKLADQVATFGMSTAQAELYRLQQQGATAADLQQVSALSSKLESLEAEAKARQDLESAAARVIESTRTPLEQFLAERAELEQLLSEGLIDTETFERALLEAGEGLGEGLADKVNAGAMELGSQEARSAILQAQGAGSADGIKGVEKVNREQLGVLASIDRNIRRQLDRAPVEAFSF